MAKNDLTDDELLALIEQEERSAYGPDDAELASDRSEALQDYLGDPDRFPHAEGRSSVVSYDTLDVIESALPQLLKIFVSGDEVVKFEPRGPEDMDAAEQETDYVNHVVMERNQGFHTLYTWFKDALISKNGYVKVWWESEDEVETESYQGLTDGQLAMLINDESVDVVEHSSYPDPMPAQMEMGQTWQPMLHDVKIEVKETKGCIKIGTVAPEDIRIAADCRTVSVQDARFVQHRRLMPREEVKEMGYELRADVGSYDSVFSGEEENARNLYGETDVDQTELGDLVVLKDTYYRVRGELLRVLSVGNQLLERTSCDVIPFACITPHIMPHRHIGRSYADLVKDIQQIKTALVRGQLDNMYLSNNGRYAISERVNLEDMLTSRPGGVVRVNGDPGGNILPLVHPGLPQQTFSMVEYLDSIKEKRTGITAYNQGLGADSLNKTATGMNIIANAAQERLALVARTFAETGVKELFLLVHRLIRKYAQKAEIVRLRNKWVEVDPRGWKNRADMSIAVGLGTGNKDQQLMHLNAMYQQSIGELQMGLPTATPDNIYSIKRQMIINAGFKNTDEFVTNPAEVPPKDPPPDPNMMKVQADERMQQQKLAMDMRSEQSKLQMQAALEKEKLDFERQKALWQLETQQEIARIKAEMDKESTMLQTNAQLQLKDAETRRAMSMDENGKAMNGAMQQIMETVANLVRQIEGHAKSMRDSQVVAIKRIRGQDGKLTGGVQVRADGSETPIQIQ